MQQHQLFSNCLARRRKMHVFTVFYQHNERFDKDFCNGSYFIRVRVNESKLFFRQGCGTMLGVQPRAILRKL